MSEENVKLIRKAFAGDLTETAETYWHPDIRYTEDPRLPGASTYKGRDVVLRCWQGYVALFGDHADTTITVERVVDAGERLVPFVRFEGRASASGVPFDHLWGYVVEVRDGRIVDFRAHYEPQEALEAAGLSE